MSRSHPLVAAHAALFALIAWSFASTVGLADLPHPDTDEALEAEQVHAENHGEPSDDEIEAQAEARAEAGEGAAAAAASPASPPPPPPGSVAEIVGHSRSISMGRANAGLLRRGVPMPDEPTLRLKSSAQGEHYGTAELVTLLVHGARTVAASAPGSQLVVGDLSRRGGGRIRPHRSHRSGRDADVGFYVLDSAGRPLPAAPAFVHMNNSLVGSRRGQSYGFDVARNWTLVESWLTHPDIHPQYIFVANPMIAALLRYARGHRASAETIRRAEAVLRQPRGSPHRSHFHVRIFCPRDDVPSCEDDPPTYPWLRTTP